MANKDRPTFFLSERDSKKQLKKIRKRHIRNQLVIAKKFEGDRARKCAFLSAFSETGNVALSCRAAGIPSTNQVNKWKRWDKAFAKYYDQAEEYAQRKGLLVKDLPRLLGASLG